MYERREVVVPAETGDLEDMSLILILFPIPPLFLILILSSAATSVSQSASSFSKRMSLGHIICSWTPANKKWQEDKEDEEEEEEEE